MVTRTADARTGALPCDVNRVLTNVCQKCHASPPRNDAPFSLVTYADTQAVMGGRPIWTYMLAALEKDEMPLPPVELDPSDRALLIAWLQADAPPAGDDDACVDDPPPPASDGGSEGAADDAASDAPDDAPPAPEPDAAADGALDDAPDATAD